MEDLAIDLFAGCGGLSTGLEDAGFKVALAVELDEVAVSVYRENHKNTIVINKDIKNVTGEEISRLLKGKKVRLLAGCPPCQGFSAMRRLNRKSACRDSRNSLILEYVRLVREIEPEAILLENVPALQRYYLFSSVIKELKELGFYLAYDVLDASQYAVPQRRRRFVLLGSKHKQPELPNPSKEKVNVFDAIGYLGDPSTSLDPLHHIYSHHGERISNLITMIPHDGGSMKDLPSSFELKCHKKKGIGFSDVYGRMSWGKEAPTITGGCLNPSKGRFLHPEQDRSISAREALLLQTFPQNYSISGNISREKIALLIGNALPPAFARAQGEALKETLQTDM